MSFDQCLRASYFDAESWTIALAGMLIAFALWRFGKTVFAMICIGASLLLAAFWAYLYYELNCVELFGM
jgi:hypothetical protein|tara:strand:+ start:129 stop:335 length:207 start_codon:yes stop_codon:yes gene_type:complete